MINVNHMGDNMRDTVEITTLIVGFFAPVTGLGLFIHWLLT